MAIRNGVELPVAYLTLALTLAAAGPGKYKIGPSLAEVADGGRRDRRRGRGGRADREDGDEHARGRGDPGTGSRDGTGG